MFIIKKKSAWKFNTSAGFSVGAGAVAGAKGQFDLDSPGGGTVVFNYVSLEGGESWGASLNDKVSGSASDKEMWSMGAVGILDNFPGNELQTSDFEGACLITELSGAVVKGLSATVMILGIDLEGTLGDVASLAGWTGGALTTSYSYSPLINHKQKLPDLITWNGNAILFMEGESEQGTIGGGLTAGLGYVWTGRHDKAINIDLLVPPHREPTSNVANDSTITVLSDALFNFDDDELMPGGGDKLTQSCAVIKSMKLKRIIVFGYTDAIGSDAYNLDLSNRRATTVAKWLVKNGYVKSDQVSTEGRGKTQPVATNSTAQGRAQNRRVQIALWPL